MFPILNPLVRVLLPILLVPHLRATAKAGKKKSGLCIVSAWAGEHRLVLGQEKVASESNEKTAIPDLLKTLELSNTLVSIDAIACEQSGVDCGKERTLSTGVEKKSGSTL